MLRSLLMLLISVLLLTIAITGCSNEYYEPQYPVSGSEGTFGQARFGQANYK